MYSVSDPSLVSKWQGKLGPFVFLFAVLIMFMMPLIEYVSINHTK